MTNIVPGSWPTLPLVSCLMVTLPVERRFSGACAAIDAYCRQSYANTELVLIIAGGTEAGQQALIDHAASLNRPDIRVVVIPGDPPLGVLRNASVAHATGEILCQWDDDDLHHPDRVARQAEALLAGDDDAVLLQDVIQYFPAAGKLYWINWRATEARGHPGTLMVRAAAGIVYPEDGHDARLGEDLRVALALHAGGGVTLVEGMPHLFVYVSHDHNSWDAGHHSNLAEQLAISTGLLRKREAALREGLAVFALAQSPLQVMGGSGPAFEL